jgi:RNA polymerase sigma factor for flagellar operon FliA
MAKKTTEEIVLEFLPMVEHIARNVIHTKKVSNDHFEDLKQCGVIGLIQSIDTFDLKRNILFKTYAEPRIRGAMLDFLRGEDPLTRRERQMRIDKTKSEEKLSQQLMRDPNENDISDDLGISVDELRDEYSESDKIIVSINDNEFDHDHLIDPRSQKVVDAIYEKERTELLFSVIRGKLNRQQALIIEKYYFNGINFETIADELGITPGRVSQVHKQALIKLKKHLKKDFGSGDFIA